MPEPERHSLAVRAASLRILLAFLAVSVIPAAAPQPPSYFWLFGGYLACALLVQTLVWKDLVRQSVRALIMGLVDYVAITFVVHRFGSAPSLLFGIYIFAGIMYALIVERSVAILLAIYGALLYAGRLGAEHRGLLPYAPGAPSWLDHTPPAPRLVLACALLGALMTVGSSLVVSQVALRLRAREEELERLSKRDPLTGLYNRRYLLERIGDELARVRRGDHLSLVVVDLDGFKRVNDELGHLHGDDILQRVAAGLRASMREVDVIGRHGGDEFLVLMPSTTRAQGEAAAQRLLERIREVGAGPHPVTASLGIAEATAGDDAESLLHRADAGLYAAKRAGGDQSAIA